MRDAGISRLKIGGVASIGQLDSKLEREYVGTSRSGLRSVGEGVSINGVVMTTGAAMLYS